MDILSFYAPVDPGDKDGPGGIFCIAAMTFKGEYMENYFLASLPSQKIQNQWIKNIYHGLKIEVTHHNEGAILKDFWEFIRNHRGYQIITGSPHYTPELQELNPVVVWGGQFKTSNKLANQPTKMGASSMRDYLKEKKVYNPEREGVLNVLEKRGVLRPESHPLIACIEASMVYLNTQK